MATKTLFSCQSCGYQSPKWLGRCPDCAKWNSMVEEDASPVGEKKTLLSDIISRSAPIRLVDIKQEKIPRVPTGIGELDRVIGGGLVKGSAILIGGEPGIGKSTLMLGLSNILSRKNRLIYVSGEESASQIKLRAERLGLASENLYILNETNIEVITGYVQDLKPDFLIIDSIQVVYHPLFSQGAGSVTQLKECSGLLTALAKSKGICVFIIGHITKEGIIAGPKILEHMVDSVIYFEGERNSDIRILRAVKNRFGPTDEIGIFSMSEQGLTEVKDPSGIFLSRAQKPKAGTCVAAVMEGTRPILVEIQALVSRSQNTMPRQRSMGFDMNRMVVLAAMLEKHAGLNLSNHDLFVNIVGGVKIDEPASDLAVCLAICSSFRDKPLRQDTVVVGEVGLTAEVRSISQARLRINEAKRLGFKNCIMPRRDVEAMPNPPIEIFPVDDIRSAMDVAFA